MAFEYIALLFTGLFAGLTGGLLGVGGSIVMIPAMTELLGPNQHLYQSAAMIVNFFVVVPAVYQHHRAGAIEVPTVRRLIPLAVVAVILGVALSELSIFAGARQIYLAGLFGLFLLCMSAYDTHALLHGRRRRANGIAELDRPTAFHRRPESPIGWRFAALVAGPTGVVAGLLGVGGGIVAVPLQRRFLNVPMRSAIANSATIIIATSLIGAAFKNYRFITGHNGSWESLRIAAILIPTAVIGASIGSRLTHRLPLTAIKVAFLLLLFVAGGRLAYRALSPASPSPASPSNEGAASAQGTGPDDRIATQADGVDSTFAPLSTDRNERGYPAADRIAGMEVGRQPPPIGGCRRQPVVADRRRSMMGKLPDRRISKATVTGLALLGLTLGTGCDSEMAKEFREVATPSLQSGVSSILNGVVDGLFAVVDPDTSESDSGGTTPTTP